MDSDDEITIKSTSARSRKRRDSIASDISSNISVRSENSNAVIKIYVDILIPERNSRIFSILISTKSTIYELKKAILAHVFKKGAREDMHPEKYTLTFKGVVLEENNIISNSGMTTGDKVYMAYHDQSETRSQTLSEDEIELPNITSDLVDIDLLPKFE